MSLGHSPGFSPADNLSPPAIVPEEKPPRRGNVNNCEEKRVRVKEGEIQKVFSLFNMMDISSRPLASLGERGVASNFLQSTASILIRSICPSRLYFSIRTPEHPDNNSMAANPQSRPRLCSQPFKPMPSQSFSAFLSVFFKEQDTITLKSQLLFLWPAVFLLLFGGAFPPEPFDDRPWEKGIRRPWLRKVDPASPIRGLADPVFPANFGNSPLPFSRFQGGRSLDLRVDLPPFYPAPLLERPFMPHLPHYLASSGRGRLTYHFPAISASLCNAVAGTVPRAVKGMGRRKNIM